MTVDTTAVALRALVLRGNAELESRRAVLAAAEARVGAAGRAAPAVLHAEFEGVPNGVDVGRAQSLRVQAEREFVSGARRSAARALATTDVDAAAASLRLAEQRVVASADRALIALVGWSAVSRRLADEDSLLLSAEGSLRARFASGEARYVDVLRLRTERLRVQTDRAAALTAAAAGWRGLEALVSDSVTLDAVRRLADAATAAGPAQPAFAALPPTPDVDSLLTASGRVRLADAAVTRATAAQRLTLAEQRPRLSGFAGVQRFAADGGFPVGPVLGASLSLPFTARGANRARAGAATRDTGTVPRRTAGPSRSGSRSTSRSSRSRRSTDSARTRWRSSPTPGTT